MKPYRSKHIKTQQSPQRCSQIGKNKQNHTFHSCLKDKRKSPKPRSFADVIKKKSNLQSTTDNKDSNKSNETATMKSSIANAINVLKENSTFNQQSKTITPFQICQQPQTFQEQLSFKGASNRLLLLAKVKEIQCQADRIFHIVKNINTNSGIDFITFKLLKQRQKSVRLSYYDFFSHLGTLTTKINHFVVELDRCHHILNQLSTGISSRTMQFYMEKFQSLITELTNSTKYLQNYIESLKRHQKQEKVALKKYVIGQSGRQMNN